VAGELLEEYNNFIRFVRTWYLMLFAFRTFGVAHTTFLGAFAKLLKATISFVVSVRPSVRMEQLSSHWTDLLEISYLRIFRKPVEKIQVCLKYSKNNR
jgi:hypothetical protein